MGWTCDSRPECTSLWPLRSNCSTASWVTSGTSTISSRFYPRHCILREGIGLGTLNPTPDNSLEGIEPEVEE